MIYHAPKILNEKSGIKAGITLSARDSYNQAEPISGLNFGESTNTSISVVKRSLIKLNDEIDHNGKIALAEQVHGADVAVVSGAGYFTGIDGLITRESDLLIGIKVADCAAILISDPVSGVIAAVHAGWRGAASGILPNAIKIMQQEEAETKNMRCYISPCLSLENFEIGEEVAEQFPSACIDRTIGKKPHLNLKAFLCQQMTDKGIRLDHIEVDARCTIDDTTFYSFRREREYAGRMLAFIKQSRK